MHLHDTVTERRAILNKELAESFVCCYSRCLESNKDGIGAERFVCCYSRCSGSNEDGIRAEMFVCVVIPGV